MAAIGTAWVDGAWVEAGWVTEAWSDEVGGPTAASHSAISMSIGIHGFWLVIGRILTEIGGWW